MNKVKKPLTPTWVLRRVTSHTGVSMRVLKSRKKTRKIKEARFIAYTLLYYKTGLSLSAIGARLGGRDHTTVGYGHKTLRNLVESGDAIREQVESLAPDIVKKWDEELAEKRRSKTLRHKRLF